MEINLNKLDINKTGIVKELNCSNTIKTRLLDLGVISGTRVTPIYRSMFNDPTAYLIRDSVLAIRENDAEKIVISVIS